MDEMTRGGPRAHNSVTRGFGDTGRLDELTRLIEAQEGAAAAAKSASAENTVAAARAAAAESQYLSETLVPAMRKAAEFIVARHGWAQVERGPDDKSATLHVKIDGHTGRQAYTVEPNGVVSVAESVGVATTTDVVGTLDPDGAEAYVRRFLGEVLRRG